VITSQLGLLSGVFFNIWLGACAAAASYVNHEM
jgi:hypothetical protein